MEELFELRERLLKGDIIKGSLAIVEELEEMSKSDIINTIISYGAILLLYLIKQRAENRSTRSWEVSIRNSVLKIQGLNKRRKAGVVYLPPEELRLALEEAYTQAINEASLEVEAGRYEAQELEQLVKQEEILARALNLILPPE